MIENYHYVIGDGWFVSNYLNNLILIYSVHSNIFILFNKPFILLYL